MEESLRKMRDKSNICSHFFSELGNLSRLIIGRGAPSLGRAPDQAAISAAPYRSGRQPFPSYCFLPPHLLVSWKLANGPAMKAYE